MSSNNNGGGLQSIPAASRKMVQSLKEIVNCPELEIYAMLKDCNMDPNEAENRLLSQGFQNAIILCSGGAMAWFGDQHETIDVMAALQDTSAKLYAYLRPPLAVGYNHRVFPLARHSLNKEITESRFRGFGNSSSRGGRGGTDRYVGRAGSTQFSSSESGVLLGKSSDNKENGTNNYTSASSLAFEMAGNNTNRRSPADRNRPTTGSPKRQFAQGCRLTGSGRWIDRWWVR
ncbi:hypothetical protein CsSME_00031433 [Camellia sinensis var. sinensis]